MLFPKYVSAQLDWSDVKLCALRKRWMDRGGADGMVSPSAALASRITQWPVGGRRSQPRVFLSASCCAATAGRRDYAFYRHVMNSLKTPVSLE